MKSFPDITAYDAWPTRGTHPLQFLQDDPGNRMLLSDPNSATQVAQPASKHNARGCGGFATGQRGRGQGTTLNELCAQLQSQLLPRDPNL